MDFWTTVAAVVIGASIWKFLDGFWSKRDRRVEEEIRQADERRREQR